MTRSLKQVKQSIQACQLVSLNQLQAALKVPKVALLTTILTTHPDTYVLVHQRWARSPKRLVEELFLFKVDAEAIFKLNVDQI